MDRTSMGVIRATTGIHPCHHSHHRDGMRSKRMSRSMCGGPPRPPTHQVLVERLHQVGHVGDVLRALGAAKLQLWSDPWPSAQGWRASWGYPVQAHHANPYPPLSPHLLVQRVHQPPQHRQQLCAADPAAAQRLGAGQRLRGSEGGGGGDIRGWERVAGRVGLVGRLRARREPFPSSLNGALGDKWMKEQAGGQACRQGADRGTSTRATRPRTLTTSLSPSRCLRYAGASSASGRSHSRVRSRCGCWVR